MQQDVRQLVGNNVRARRRVIGISQAELAERMSVDRAYISGLERGERNITIITLWHTAIALGVTMAELVREPATGQAPKSD